MALHSAKQNVANMQWLSAQVADPTCRELSRINPRRLLGAYYTPDALASSWARAGTRPWKGERLRSELWRVCVP